MGRRWAGKPKLEAREVSIVALCGIAHRADCHHGKGSSDCASFLEGEFATARWAVRKDVEAGVQAAVAGIFRARGCCHRGLAAAGHVGQLDDLRRVPVRRCEGEGGTAVDPGIGRRECHRDRGHGLTGELELQGGGVGLGCLQRGRGDGG